MKIYRHRRKLNELTKEALTEKYGNNFEGQYLLLYSPDLEINIHNLPYYIEQFGQKEWRDMTWKLARTEGQMNMMDKSQMGGMAGDIQMIDMIKLLSAEDQAILLEQALSDKKVLLNAAKKLEAEDKHFAPVSNFTKVDGSPQIITKNTSSISATAVYEVDGALQRAMNQ